MTSLEKSGPTVAVIERLNLQRKELEHGSNELERKDIACLGPHEPLEDTEKSLDLTARCDYGTTSD
jgi:hypothetical protein